jgi:hypothetical protein
MFWLVAWAYGTAYVAYFWGIMAYGSTLDLLSLPPLDRESTNYALLVGTICIFPFLVIFLGMGASAIYSLLWQIAGKEIIEVNHQHLIITRQIFNWKRAKEYPLKIANQLRLSSKKSSSIDTIRAARKLLGKDGLIMFDYGSKDFRFGLGIDEVEAKQIISVIQRYVPSQSTG